MVVANEAEVGKRAAFTAAIGSKLGNSLSLPTTPFQPPVDNEYDFEPYGDDNEAPFQLPEADIVDATGKPVIMQSLADGLINAEVMLPVGDSQAMAKVVSCAVDSDGRLIGEHNNNPILNSLCYMCEFPDGTVKEFLANVIASNIYEESDADGYSSSLLYKIVDHKSSGEAVKIADKYITSANGNKRICQTTVGWKFLVEWIGGNQEWISLEILKESNPVQVAEFAVARNIADEPAFAWWVHYVLRKREVIVSAVTSRVARTTHKYGIEMLTPGKKTIESAMELDRQNRSTL
jgi:hypothetical protein